LSCVLPNMFVGYDFVMSYFVTVHLCSITNKLVKDDWEQAALVAYDQGGSRET
jgi:hypothetical protein